MLFSTYSYSQIHYSHYIDETSEWSSYSISYLGMTTTYYSTVYFDGTEDHNGYTYYKRYAFVSENGYLIDTPGYGLYREGSDGNFYSYDPETDVEQIQFENTPIANAQVGQNFNLLPTMSQQDCPITTISTISIAGLILKHIQGLVSSSAGIVEGIGNIGAICMPTLDRGGGLACYTKQG